MGVVKLKVSQNNPCRICGKPDYCFRLEYDDGGLNHCCARVSDNIVINSGIEYVCIKNKDTSIGTYYYYQDKESRDAFLDKIRKENSNKVNYTNRMSSGAFQVKPVANDSNQNSLIYGEYPVASDDTLDATYRRFLSLLTLSKSDYMRLKNEWDTPSTGNLTDRVLAFYPIRTLAPDDKIRNLPNYAGDSKLPFRKKICEQLMKEGYTLRGVPGFYLDNATWSYSGAEGILFPIFNVKGQIVRLRLRVSYPIIKAVYQSKEGNFNHVYSKMGEHLWFWNPKEKESGDSCMVWSPNKHLISLKEDGCPSGKANAKYKNFASVWEKIVEKDGVKKVINGYGWGTRSGSSISLYTKPGDDCSVVYVTEGEKKAMIANMLLNVPVISLPGTGTFGKLFEVGEDGISIMDIMVQRGMKLCVIAYDADKNTNIQVLKQEQKAVAAFIERGIRIAIGEWNANFGKGLDDILVMGVRPSIYLCA